MSFQESIPMRLRRAYLSMHRWAQRHFAQFDVTVDQYVILSLLADKDDVSQKDLANRMCSDANTVGSMVSLLESRGLVRRERSEEDRRARRVHLSAAGRRVQKELSASERPLHDLLNSAIDMRDRDLFFECLAGISDTMVNALANQSPET